MANRKAVASELNRHKNNAREKSTMSKKLQKAERVLDKRDADEKGEDWERSQAWKYSIEDNERWEERLEKKEEGKDQGAVGALYLNVLRAKGRLVQELIHSSLQMQTQQQNDRIGGRSNSLNQI